MHVSRCGAARGSHTCQRSVAPTADGTRNHQQEESVPERVRFSSSCARRYRLQRFFFDINFDRSLFLKLHTF
jgi:hypothetical protein